MQKSQALINDIKDAMKKTLDSLEELESLYEDVLFEVEEREMIMRALDQQPLTFQQVRKLKNSQKRNVPKLLSALVHSAIVQIFKNASKISSQHSQIRFLKLCIIDCFRWD